ncbi:uncharacterized protein LOC127097640 isoform X2 [Lathyrus oleraceus]|uniref:uncharacterized protein LOC127097640 isoform X2 n=1 Tax=Pisum sativum TaxID=3888 RepID=UPI0021D3781B|nr:uncharacterized protein LOC127097640 isoform X2 [Pisum sativum]
MGYIGTIFSNVGQGRKLLLHKQQQLTHKNARDTTATQIHKPPFTCVNTVIRSLFISNKNNAADEVLQPFPLQLPHNLSPPSQTNTNSDVVTKIKKKAEDGSYILSSLTTQNIVSASSFRFCNKMILSLPRGR